MSILGLKMLDFVCIELQIFWQLAPHPQDCKLAAVLWLEGAFILESTGEDN